MSNEASINKNLYKIFLTIVRYIPISLSLFTIIGLCLNLTGIRVMVLTYIGGTSIIFIGLLYLIAEIFKFCWMYKVPLWYLTIMIIMNMLRSFGFLPLDLVDLYRVYAVITGIFGSLFIGHAYKNRNNPNNKIDYIKNLCDRYCKC